MPTIDKEYIAEFMKPTKMNIEVGDKAHFKIMGSHQQGEKGLYSLPVLYNKTEGNFPLNKTNTRIIVSVLGNNSDNWVDSEFDAVVIPVNNPQTGATVSGWMIKKDSFKNQKSIK